MSNTLSTSNSFNKKESTVGTLLNIKLLQHMITGETSDPYMSTRMTHYYALSEDIKTLDPYLEVIINPIEDMQGERLTDFVKGFTFSAVILPAKITKEEYLEKVHKIYTIINTSLQERELQPVVIPSDQVLLNYLFIQCAERYYDNYSDYHKQILEGNDPLNKIDSKYCPVILSPNHYYFPEIINSLTYTPSTDLQTAIIDNTNIYLYNYPTYILENLKSSGVLFTTKNHAIIIPYNGDSNLMLLLYNYLSTFDESRLSKLKNFLEDYEYYKAHGINSILVDGFGVQYDDKDMVIYYKGLNKSRLGLLAAPIFPYKWRDDEFNRRFVFYPPEGEEMTKELAMQIFAYVFLLCRKSTSKNGQEVLGLNITQDKRFDNLGNITLKQMIYSTSHRIIDDVFYHVGLSAVDQNMFKHIFANPKLSPVATEEQYNKLKQSENIESEFIYYEDVEFHYEESRGLGIYGEKYKVLCTTDKKMYKLLVADGKLFGEYYGKDYTLSTIITYRPSVKNPTNPFIGFRVRNIFLLLHYLKYFM